MTAALSRPTTELVDTRALEPAERARLVEVERGRIRFVHPMFASAVYRSADPVARRRVHLALSEVVREPEEQARHLALASTVPDEAIAARLDEAAAMVAARGAPDAAAELVDLAIDSTPSSDVEAVAQRRVNGARDRLDAGDLGTAESMLRRALDENGDGPWRVRALRLLSQLHGRRSNFDDAARDGPRCARPRAGRRDAAHRDRSRRCVLLHEPGRLRLGTGARAPRRRRRRDDGWRPVGRGARRPHHLRVPRRPRARRVAAWLACCSWRIRRARPRS